MARGRMIDKTLSTSEKRARLHTVTPKLAEFCQAIYPLLVAHADDYGRQQGDPFTVKYAVDPTSPRGLKDFAAALTALHTVNLIEWYEVDGRQFIYIVGFSIHQDLHKQAQKSRFPESPGIPRGIRESPEDSGIPALREEKGREEKRREKSVSSVVPSAPPEPPVLTFPTSGQIKSWDLTESQLREWLDSYQQLDVEAECRKALQWVKANQRKTAGGMPRFLVRWLNKAVNDGNGIHRGPEPTAVVVERKASPFAAWFIECGEMHGGKCLSSKQHTDRLERDKAVSE